MAASDDAPDIGAYTLPGNRYGALNQDYVEVWRAGSTSAAGGCGSGGSESEGSGGGGAAAIEDDGDAAGGGDDGGGLPPLVIGAVLDGHGMLGERAARAAGAAVVRELRRLIGLAAARGGESSGGGGGSGGGGSSGDDGATAGAANNGADAAGPGRPGSSHSSGGNSRHANDGGGGNHGKEEEEEGCRGRRGRGRRRRALADMPEEELHAIVAAAFAAAHACALAIYDDPPATAAYPDAATGAPATYSLHPRAPGAAAGAPDMYRACPPGSGGGGGGTGSQNNGGGGAWRPLEFGATCTVAALQGARLVIGNCGDSSAVLATLQDDGDLAARVLTRQHCGLQPDEAARIAGGYAGRGVRIEPRDGYMAISAPSPWAGYQLAVTRALGHKHMETYGVLHAPSVAVVDVQAADCCVVLASDGIWDAMGPREAACRAMDALGAGEPAAAAARALVEGAVALAEGAPAGDADNASAVVLALPGLGCG